jgi:lipopolysaccharide transport system permease protein
MRDVTEQGEVLAVRVITPHTGLDAFADAIRSLADGARQAGSLAWRFFVRDTRADHRQSLLGYVWLVVPILANTVTWVFLNQQKLISVNSGNVSYPLFVMTGAILWAAFNGGVMAMLGIVGSARSYLAKVNFPHEALVYSAILKGLLDAAISIVLLSPVLVLLHAGWRTEILFFPLAVAANLLLGVTVGLILVPIASLYVDVSRGVQLVLRFGFFLTPVIFPIAAGGIARRIMMLNPATYLITTGRAWLTGSAEAMVYAFWLVTIASAIVFAISLVIYKLSMPVIIERVGG